MVFNWFAGYSVLLTKSCVAPGFARTFPRPYNWRETGVPAASPEVPSIRMGILPKLGKEGV